MCVAAQVNGENNYYNPRYHIGNYVPDVIVRKNDKVVELHEIEAVPIRLLPQIEGVKRVLWFALRKKGWDDFKIIYAGNSATEKIEHASTALLDAELTISKLKTHIAALEAEAISLKKHRDKLMEKNTLRILNQLPYFEFKKSMDPNTCLICSRPSAIIIDASPIGTYGLCSAHFDRLMSAEGEKD